MGIYEIKATVKSYKKLWIQLLVAHLLILGALVLSWKKETVKRHFLQLKLWTIPENTTFDRRKGGDKNVKVTNEKSGPSCPDVLGSMMDGQWISKPSSAEERAVLKASDEKARACRRMKMLIHTGNGSCGASHYVGQYHRRLCDPEGSFPCCYKGKCVSKEQKDCLCEDCIDLRQRVIAEFASWFPKDPSCKLSSFQDTSDICRLLRNMTIYFIGDSLVRHIYTSLLQFLRQDVRHGPLMANSSEEKIRECHNTVLYSWFCKGSLDKDCLVCNQSAVLKFRMYTSADMGYLTVKTIDELRKTPNSFVVMGVGIHDNFDHDKVIKQYVNPVLQKLSEVEWPKALWVTSGSPGLLKIRKGLKQRREDVLEYNAKVREALEKKGLMAICDIFNVTSDVRSFDGTHFGKGVNDLKAQILLNYIWELRYISKDPNLHLDFKLD